MAKTEGGSGSVFSMFAVNRGYKNLTFESILNNHLMITVEIKGQEDRVWDALWSNGIVCNTHPKARFLDRFKWTSSNNLFSFFGVVVSLVWIVIIAPLSGCGNSVIDGYCDQMSYQPGDTITCFLSADKNEDARLNVHTLSGDVVHTFQGNLWNQPIQDSSVYEHGFHYLESGKFVLPKLKSGVYLIENKVPFVVKPDRDASYDALVVYSSNTENAYSNSGGRSMYSSPPADITTFLRPIRFSHHGGAFFRWLEDQKDYNFGVVCDKDLDDQGVFNACTELVILPGHSEYWTRKARLNFDEFVLKGGNALVLSGNTMWWQVRYSVDGNKMICYKNEAEDPELNQTLKTVNWTNPKLGYPIVESIGLNFDLGGYGKKEDLGWDGFKILTTSSLIFDGINIAPLDILSLPSDEYDGAKLEFSAETRLPTLINDFGFHRYELFGFDIASRLPNSNGAWVAFQRTDSSGIVINVGSTNWCHEDGIYGVDSDRIQQLTRNMIHILKDLESKDSVEAVFN